MFGFTVGNAVLGLAANRFFTQVVSAQALGEYFLYMNLVLWLTLPSLSVFPYFWKHWPVARARRAVRAFLAAIMGVMGLQVILAVAGSGLIFALGLGGAAAATFIGVTALGTAVNVVPEGVQSLERRRVVAGLLSLLATPGRLAVLAAGALLFPVSGLSLIGAQAGFMVLSAALCVGAFLAVLRELPPEGSAEQPGAAFTPGYVFRYSAPFFVAGLFQQAAMSAERWGLAALEDPGATARFVLAVGLSTTAVGTAVTALNTYFHPLISQAAARGTDCLSEAVPLIWRYLGLSALVLAALVVCVWAFARPATALLFGPAFQDVALLLPVTTFGYALFALAQCFAFVPMVAGRPVGLNAVVIVSKGAYVAAILLWPRHGDVAWTFSALFAAGNALYLALTVALARHHTRASRLASGSP